MGIEAHPNFEAIRSFVNTTLALLKEKQTFYFSRVGGAGYFQGLRIPSQAQLDGESFGPVDFGRHPDDQSESWGSLMPGYFNAETRIPVNISVQTYTTPENKHGWIFMAEFWKAGLGPDLYGNTGDHWIWQHNEGPDIRAGIWDDWFCIVDEIL